MVWVHFRLGAENLNWTQMNTDWHRFWFFKSRSVQKLINAKNLFLRRDLDQDSPLGLAVSTEGPIRYRNVLGGIIRDYHREAA
jgi:hypothetical protein